MRIRQDKEFYNMILSCYNDKYVGKIESRILDNNYSGIKDLLERGVRDNYLQKEASINKPILEKRKKVYSYFIDRYYSR